MPITMVEFFKGLELNGNYLRIAKIYGDENELIDKLNELLEEKRKQLQLAQTLSDDCKKCSKVFCVEMRRDGTFVFVDACCAMRDVLTIEDVRGCLCHEFDHFVESA